MMIGCSMAGLLLACVPSVQEARAPERPVSKSQKITLEPRSGSGVLAIQSALAPGEAFEFVTIEALVDTHSTSALYPLKLEPTDWKREGESVGYSWTFPDKARLDFRAVAGEGECELEYALTNLEKAPLERLLIYPCLPTLGVPSFYPGSPDEAATGTGGRKARVGRNDYTALYERLFLWESGKRFSFKDSALAPDERHLAFMRKGETPLVWSWFVNDERTFDVPLLAATSRDGKQSIGYAIDGAIQASSNCGDGRACIHMVPFFGNVEPGKTVKVTGRIYWIEGSPEDVLARFREDFPALAKK
jgi:hypothetical protein